jgi:hypothetical protein
MLECHFSIRETKTGAFCMKIGSVRWRNQIAELVLIFRDAVVFIINLYRLKIRLHLFH